MPTKSTIRLPRGLDRRVRRSRVHPAAARAPRTLRRPPPHHGATAQQRIDAALAALAPNTRTAYASAWSAWQRWAATSGCQAIPASAADVAVYLEARHAGGAAPATIRVARASIAKVHQASGLADPTADSLCRDVLHRIGREGRHRGRGQVAGIGWAQAEAAAALAGDGSSGLQGLRDAAIILVLSDTLARISEVAALQCRDLEAYTTNAGGSVHITASKADQFGEGSTRYIGPATRTAINRYLQAADHATGPLFRRVLRGGHGSSAPLAADSIRTIVRKRVAAVPGSGGRVGGHSFRVGSARELAAAGASVAELQQAGGWRSPATPEIYIRREAAARGPVARHRYRVRR